MSQTSLAAELVERGADAARRRSAAEIDRLLGAAEAALTKGGYAGLRVDDVLAEAGLSTRAFYRRFRGKSELFLALFDREAVRAGERLRAVLARADDAEARVRAWIEATLALAYDARLARRTRLFLVERHVLTTEFPELVARCVRALLEPLEDAIAAGRDEGIFPGADPVADALAIHHLCAGLTSDRLLGTSNRSRANAVALAERFALTTLTGGSSS